jgi:hypothetical protein
MRAADRADRAAPHSLSPAARPDASASGGFDPHELRCLPTDRQAVRLALMRATVRLVSVADTRFLRPSWTPAG